jgi:hypothetical protein
MDERCHTEIIELHDFFQQWLTGFLARDDDAFRRVSRVLGEGFVLITPDGTREERAPLLDRLRAAHDTRRDLRMWIEGFRVHHREGDLLIATYEEWQETGGATTARLSTAVFRAKEGVPHGVEWLHVHETWMAAQE